MSSFNLFIACPRGLEYLLEEECRALGLHISRVNPQGVYGEASLQTIYNLCLWSRLANRVQLILFSGQGYNEQTISRLCAEFPWQTVFTADKSIAVEFHGASDHIRNTMYGAQLVKDGIVDHFKRLTGQRPSVDKKQAQIRIHAYLKQNELTVSLDMAGYSLHERGYRSRAGQAPLKENVAAAMLIRAQWPKLAAQGYALHDPVCGSGTLVIEAAMMAAHIAPGLLRQDQAFQHWAKHEQSLWEKMRSHALAQVKPCQGRISGSDEDAAMIDIARQNADKAGVGKLVHFSQKALRDCQAEAPQGLLIGNPPYGERLGEMTALIPLYQQLGLTMAQSFPGWQAAMITSSPMLAKAIGLRANKQYTLFNGALECKLYCFSITADNELKGTMNERLSEGATMFQNRLQKNVQHLQKWAKKNQISCYRIYDADLPEYAFAIDLYEDYVVLQEYKAPASIPAHKAEKRSLEALQVVPQVLGIPAQNLVMKQRQQQKGKQQYEKKNETGQRMIVHEGAAKFWVNLRDYLDTGLFLDHRPMRLRFGQLPAGTRFLNCFCYTATASVHAALAGALTTNVDLSNTYLNWAQDNFRLNDLDSRLHQFIQFDCLEWLKRCKDRFDVIFLDPPSFSNSKRMEADLDIQRDHVQLIRMAMRLLNPDGRLYFSTNLRQFKLDPEALANFQINDLTSQSIDLDFKRNNKIHQCYELLSPLS